MSFVGKPIKKPLSSTSCEILKSFLLNLNLYNLQLGWFKKFPLKIGLVSTPLF